MIATNLHGRGVPWMRLDAPREDGAEAPTVRRRSAQATNTILTWLAIVCVGLALYLGEPRFLWGAMGSLLPVLYRNRGHYAFFRRRCGLAFALASVPLDLVNYTVNGVAVAVGWALRQLVGDAKPDPTVQAFAEVGIKTWPPVPSRSVMRGAGSSLTR
jgi:hypothetical protein